MSIQHAFQAHAQSNAHLHPKSAPQSTIVSIGNAGALGEAMLARLLASSRYARVIAATTQNLHTSAPRLLATDYRALFDSAAWAAANGDEIPTDAAILIGGAHSFLKRDDAFPVVPVADAIRIARAARMAGVARLLVVAPMDPWSGMTLGSLAQYDELERALVPMGFETLIMVRPTEYRQAPRISRDVLKWIASMMLGTLAHYMTTASRQPLRAQVVAEAAVEWLAQLPPGLHRQDAVALHEWVESRRLAASKSVAGR